MNRGLRLLSAAGLGAGLMYLFDPALGKRRRALVRDKMKHAAKVASDVIGKTGRDVRNHLLGVLAEAGSLFRSRDVSDDVVKGPVLQGGQPGERLGAQPTNWSPTEEFADVLSHVHETRCNMFMR